MKKLIVAFVIALVGSAATVNAQKIGHINEQELMASMPETKKAQDKLQKVQDSLNIVYSELIKELNEKDSLFAADSAKWTPSKREIKRDELKNLYVKVQGYQQEAQQFLQQQESRLLEPVQKAALEAVQAVAKNNGYTYVISRSTLIVAPPGDDLLPLVKKYLKIPDAPPAGK
jgi:outer membrane protein